MTINYKWEIINKYWKKSVSIFVTLSPTFGNIYICTMEVNVTKNDTLKISVSKDNVELNISQMIVLTVHKEPRNFLNYSRTLIKLWKQQFSTKNYSQMVLSKWTCKCGVITIDFLSQLSNFEAEYTPNFWLKRPVWIPKNLLKTTRT